MTLLDRITPALRSALFPLGMLMVALSTVFVFSGDRGYFYRGINHNWASSQHLAIAVNLSLEHGFQRFERRAIDGDGATRYQTYNRFPIGGYAAMKLATLPFGGSPSAQLYAARILMLLFFTGAAVLAYLSLCRLTSSRWIALTATLLAFSSYYLLYYNDMTANEGIPDFFGVMLTFHGMVVFVQEGRFRQLLVKACIALLLGWHVFALLLPFVIFGLTRDLLRARSASAASPPLPRYVKAKQAAVALLRSRYLLLGIAALGFGLAVLAFNFTMDYIALEGERPLTELPSFQSMLSRTSLDQGVVQASWPWADFLEGQFYRIFRLFIPYALLSVVGAAEGPSWLPGSVAFVLGGGLSAASLIGSMFVRPRILFATLASFGFFWALPMRNTTELHHYETIYYIGLPLVFFTIVLLLGMRLIRRDAVIAAATVAALLLFGVSSFLMSRVGYSAESAQAARAAEQDLLTIRELTAGEFVTVGDLIGIRKTFFRPAGHGLSYYLNLALMNSEYPPPAGRKFIVTRHRVDTDALLTPQNQYLFLYDAPGLLASYRSAYPSLVSTEPLASEDFDVHLVDRTVYYLREPCEHEDTRSTFFLHVFPEDKNDLPYHRREHGFDNLDFVFTDLGLLFDGKCMLRVDLPQFDIAGLRTGRLEGGGAAWSTAYVVQGTKLISEYESIVSTEPVARSEFDLYFDGDKLHYVKQQCGDANTHVPFFLHVFPEDIDDLPDERKQYGFDNLDFGFDVHGVLFDGKCAAAVSLPQYGIARIITGQFDGTDRIWEVEIDQEARE